MPPEPKEELDSKIRSLQNDLNTLQRDARLAKHRDRLENLTSTIGAFTTRVAELRRRGYPFENDLETRAADLQQRWPDVREHTRRRIDQEERQLQMDLRMVERQMDQLLLMADNPQSAAPLVTRTEQAINALENKTRAVSSTIDGTYDQFAKQAEEMDARLTELAKMLDLFEQATFHLLPQEGAIAAVRAKWDKDGKEDPNGVLYLTDQRLLYEQKEDIATKKVLFFTTEKKRVHQLLLDVPLGYVNAVRPSKRGLLGHEDHLDVDLAPEAAVPTVHWHIDGQDCNRWQGWIMRAKAGEFDRDRTVKPDEAMTERIKNVPTRCPACNAPLTQTIVRGVDSIRCEYCGEVIRI